MGYREMMRRKLLEDIYDRMTDEERRIFIRMTIQDKDHKEIMDVLDSQRKELSDIRRGQSWWLDLSSNVAGNAIFDSLVWIGSKIIRRL